MARNWKVAVALNTAAVCASPSSRSRQPLTGGFGGTAESLSYRPGDKGLMSAPPGGLPQ